DRVGFVTMHGANSASMTEAIFKYQSWIRLALLPLLAIGPTLVLRGRTGLRYSEHRGGGHDERRQRDGEACVRAIAVARSQGDPQLYVGGRRRQHGRARHHSV